MTTPNDGPYLIWSWQHRSWWKAGGWGYTPNVAEAGRFDRDEVDGQLRWDEFREFDNNGFPHEVYIALPPVDEIGGKDVIEVMRRAMALIDKRVQEATQKAIQDRTNAGGDSDAPR